MVVGKDAKNCFTDTAYVRVKVYPIPTVEAGEDKTVNVGQSVDLIPRISSDVTRVVWSPTSGIYRNTYPGITVKPTQTTVYRVEVSNEGGCAATDNLTVNVICNNANVFIPNTFSPNADGVNDIFYPRGTGLFRIKSAKIFSRWGEIVYEKNDFTANDPTKGWDGTFKGKQLSPDVYVYVIEVMCDNNNIIPFKGNVALIR
ncbi:MAG: gliding motility-associated C-terminal domain-containing protein [Bacteroidetes bacterium]|nr:gliding motility-associated C-terminal domain-containing protein [Bacteroidota bacterium]